VLLYSRTSLLSSTPNCRHRMPPCLLPNSFVSQYRGYRRNQGMPAFSHFMESLPHNSLQRALTRGQQFYKNVSLVRSPPLPAYVAVTLQSIHQAHDAMVFQM
jgi:hypothetical protein